MIIPRDEHGNPATVESTSGESVGVVCAEEQPLWQDQQLQEEVMAAKGVELIRAPTHKGKGKGLSI